MPTPKRRIIILSLVERGWRAARECSLDLQQRGGGVTHLVKGRLNQGVRSMIAPKPNINIIDVPRSLFPLQLWLTLLFQSMTGRLQWILIDNGRTAQQLAWWCARFHLVPVVVREVKSGYELSVNHQIVSFKDVFGL